MTVFHHIRRDSSEIENETACRRALSENGRKKNGARGISNSIGCSFSRCVRPSWPIIRKIFDLEYRRTFARARHFAEWKQNSFRRCSKKNALRALFLESPVTPYRPELGYSPSRATSKNSPRNRWKLSTRRIRMSRSVSCEQTLGERTIYLSCANVSFMCFRYFI